LPAPSPSRLDLARRVQRAYPDDFWANHRLGTDLSASGKPLEAIHYHTAALALQPRNPGTYLNRSLAFERSQNLAQALADINQAIDLAPRYAVAWRIKGRLLQKMKDRDRAEAALRQALVLNPKDTSARSLLIGQLNSAGRHRDVEVELRQALALDPNDALAHYNLGNALSMQNKLEEASDFFRKAIELDEKNAGARQALGLVLRRQKKLDEAVAYYKKAIELDPKAVWAHHDLALILREQNKLEEASDCFHKAIELDEKNASARQGLGLVLREQKKLDEAVACYKKAIAFDPKAVWAHHNLGVVLLAQGKPDEAIAAIEEAIRLQPNHATAHFGLASVLAQANQWDRSASAYAEALQRSGAPLWPGPWYGAIRSDEVFTRLTALRPDDRLPWIVRARLHVFQRDWKRAAADYARVNESWASIDPAKLLGEGDDLMGYACLFLLLGDRPGYEQFCKKWADRVGPGQGWGYSLARAWGVSPRTVVSSQQIVEWARTTVQDRRNPWDLHVLSLAHYRNGEFDLAMEFAKESNAGYWRGGAKALNWLVLAMAQHRLGQAAEARTSLEQALELAGRVSPEQPPGVEWPDMTPADLLEIELLHREVEDLIDPKSSQKQDKDKR
jgi:tetratricopeptide (TPR) repeat protein